MAIDKTELRSMVRDVLREAMATRMVSTTGPTPVRITSDADLQAFVARLSAPGVIDAVRSGAMKFILTNVNATPAAFHATTCSNTTSMQAMDGVVSERKLASITRGTTVKLTANAVVTPMGKDIARRLGLKFERIET